MSLHKSKLKFGLIDNIWYKRSDLVFQKSYDYYPTVP